MATRYIRYRRALNPRARVLRRDSTRAERKLWFEYLSTLPEKFTRQKPLGSYIADFYCASAKLVLEVDGDTHYADGGPERDAKRTEDLGRLGIRVVRFTNDDVVYRFEAVCGEISKLLQKS